MPAVSPSPDRGPGSGPGSEPGQPDQERRLSDDGLRLSHDGGHLADDGRWRADDGRWRAGDAALQDTGGADLGWARPEGWPGDAELAAADDPYGDPGCPPSWLAGLTVPERETYYDAVEARLAAGRAAEVLEAGFADRGSGGGGAGFSGGGPADRLAPGPVLAGLAARAWDDGLGRLDDDELVGVLLAARRLCSWQAAVELEAVAELDRRRQAAAELERRRRAAAELHRRQAASRGAGPDGAGRDRAGDGAGRDGAGGDRAGDGAGRPGGEACCDPRTAEELAVAL